MLVIQPGDNKIFDPTDDYHVVVTSEPEFAPIPGWKLL